jgi:hypothetical protein
LAHSQDPCRSRRQSIGHEHRRRRERNICRPQVTTTQPLLTVYFNTCPSRHLTFLSVITLHRNLTPNLTPNLNLHSYCRQHSADKLIKMVILGGLEIVAAGYLIHKHQQNKKDRARAEEEAAYLEEEEYRNRHSRHGHRSHSHRRHSRERRHSYDGKHEYRRESPRPAKSAMKPTAPQQAFPPAMPQQSVRPPSASMAQPSMQAPPPYNAVPTATPQPPQDIKYGWTDENTPQTQQPPRQDPNFPPTGWPQEWPQSQAPDPGARLQTPYQRGEPSRGRGDGRAVSASPRVRFATPRRDRSPSFSPPPPSYRA